VGLLYSLLGVLVLSELLIANPGWKALSVDWIAPMLLWAHLWVPLGLLGGALLGYSRTSATVVERFSFGFIAYSMIPLTLFEWTVVLPCLARFRNLQSRWQWFGLLLVMSGIVLQLTASVMAL
jgi:hypothetical protein